MNKNLIIIKQLDEQLLPLKKQKSLLIPKQGWVRTLRKALGMTIEQLAKRLQVSSARIVKIESSENEGTLTLHTLRSVASALNCEFTYTFLPRTNLETLIKKRAKHLAEQQIQRTAHTMSLEAQSVSKKWLEDQISELSYELLQKSWKHLWEEE